MLNPEITIAHALMKLRSCLSTLATSTTTRTNLFGPSVALNSRTLVGKSATDAIGTVVSNGCCIDLRDQTISGMDKLAIASHAAQNCV